MTLVAPITSRRRIEVLPAFVMPLNRSLPPLEFCRGTSPSHAANWRPFLKTEGSGTVAAIAEAVIGPTPGIVARLQLASSDLCQARFAVPVRQYAYRIR